MNLHLIFRISLFVISVVLFAVVIWYAGHFMRMFQGGSGASDSYENWQSPTNEDRKTLETFKEDRDIIQKQADQSDGFVNPSSNPPSIR